MPVVAIAQLTPSVQCRFSWSSIQVIWMRAKQAGNAQQHYRDIYNGDCRLILTVCVFVSDNSTWKPRHHRGVDPLDTRLDRQLLPPIRRHLDSFSSGFVRWRPRHGGTVVANQRRGGEQKQPLGQSESGIVVLLCSASLRWLPHNHKVEIYP